jgi:hypothetical protein
MRYGQQLTRRCLIGNRIALRDRHPDGSNGVALDADARHALGRLRQPRDPPTANDLLMRVARGLAAVHQV